MTDIHLTVTVFSMLRGFLGVKWFSVILIQLDRYIILDIPKDEVGSKVDNPTPQIKY